MVSGVGLLSNNNNDLFTLLSTHHGQGIVLPLCILPQTFVVILQMKSCYYYFKEENESQRD